MANLCHTECSEGTIDPVFFPPCIPPPPPICPLISYQITAPIFNVCDFFFWKERYKKKTSIYNNNNNSFISVMYFLWKPVLYKMYKRFSRVWYKLCNLNSGDYFRFVGARGRTAMNNREQQSPIVRGWTEVALINNNSFRGLAPFYFVSSFVLCFFYELVTL